MKRKLKIMNHQIDQLKDEIAGKENVLAKTTLDFTKIQKEKISLTAEIDQMKKRHEDSRKVFILYSNIDRSLKKRLKTFRQSQML